MKLVTIAILDAAWMTYNGDIFHNHDKKIKYCPKLNSGKAALSCKYGG